MRLFNRLIFAVILAPLAVDAAQAQTTINFNDGIAGTPIGAFYTSQGVTFDNAQFTNFFGCCGFSDILSGNYRPQPGSSITATFTDAISFASLLGQDVGGNGFLFRAFDAAVGGNLLAESQVFGTTPAGVGEDFTLSLTASGIRRLEISQVQTGAQDGITFDNLTFQGTETVPEPATLTLLATGLAAVYGSSRRRRKATTAA